MGHPVELAQKTSVEAVVNSSHKSLQHDIQLSSLDFSHSTVLWVLQMFHLDPD